MVRNLQDFWSSHGCISAYPYDTEKGAGTLNPMTMMRALGPKPWRVVYVEPSRRPADGRYGENPNRLYQHHQLQVLIKPADDSIQNMYIDSLKHLGLDPGEHDIRFVECNWENPTFGAAGVGWEVWLDGMEITQFTYFQQVGSLDVDPVSVEITYGLERLACYIQDVQSIYDLDWTDNIKYADVFKRAEYEHSKYTFEYADASLLFELFSLFEREATDVLSRGLVYPAYDYLLKCSHTFNLLDARGVISISERVAYIERIRKLARKCAETYVESEMTMERGE